MSNDEAAGVDAWPAGAGAIVRTSLAIVGSLLKSRGAGAVIG
jgi:hypothetical protein